MKRQELENDFISIEKLFQAWEEFRTGKKKKDDVLSFEYHLEDNLFNLYQKLKEKTYEHGSYKSFYVRDPKVRHIHKAKVADRVVHHLISKRLEKIFDKTFYEHSYSCRKNKGTHKAVKAFIKMARKASKNNTSKLYILKCDIKKFFASVDHQVLKNALGTKISDPYFLWLLDEVIDSFQMGLTNAPLFSQGMPIGNLTSQLFANIYLDLLDQFMKHELKVKYYIRYADDFAILSENKSYLESLLFKIDKFLNQELKLSLHPNKISIRDYYLGIDFLGYIVFPYYVIPRTKTRRRLFKKIYKKIQAVRNNQSTLGSLNQTTQSYLGHLSHANTFKLTQDVKNRIWFWLHE